MTDRQTKILEIVNQKKKVEVVTLSQMLEVSQVTIRKDLDALEELNFLTREHGYATMKNMSDISNRMAFCYETKQRIAKPILSPKGFETITLAHWEMNK